MAFNHASDSAIRAFPPLLCDQTAARFAPRRRLVLTADGRCIQQWLPSASPEDLTTSSRERRQALLEDAAAAIAAHVLAGKRGGLDAVQQLLTLSARCAPKFELKPSGGVTLLSWLRKTSALLATGTLLTSGQ